MEDGFTNIKSKEYFDSKLCLQTIGDWIVTDTLNEPDEKFGTIIDTGTIQQHHATDSNGILNHKLHETTRNSRKTWRPCPDNNLRFELDMGVLMHTVKKAKK